MQEQRSHELSHFSVRPSPSAENFSSPACTKKTQPAEPGLNCNDTSSDRSKIRCGNESETSLASYTSSDGNVSAPLVPSKQNGPLAESSVQSNELKDDPNPLLAHDMGPMLVSTATETLIEGSDPKDTAAEIAALRELVASLRKENKRLKEEAKSAKLAAATAALNEGPPAGADPSSSAITSRLPSSESTSQPKSLTAADTENKGVHNASEVVNKVRKGRAPGAPPNGRGPGRKLPGTMNKCWSSSSNNNLRLWGWCLQDESVSSLRGCCVDHLVDGGSCCTEEKTDTIIGGSSSCRKSIEGSTATAPATLLPPEPLEASWLLGLEEIVQSTLAVPQQDQQQALAPSLNRVSSRNSLKSVVEEIGFSGWCPFHLLHS